MSKIYTGRGDAGETDLFSGQCVPKHCQRVDAYGTIDELQAVLGLARAHAECEKIADDIYDVEVKLMDVMAELASLDAAVRIDSADVASIEATIDSYAAQFAEDFRWDVPGASKLSAILHIARTIARRAERRMCELHQDEPIGSCTLQYVNRLSDLCYVMARFVDEAA